MGRASDLVRQASVVVGVPLGVAAALLPLWVLVVALVLLLHLPSRWAYIAMGIWAAAALVSWLVSRRD